MRKFLILLLLLIANVGVKAAFRLTADAPSEVTVGEQFRLTYTLNTQDAENSYRDWETDRKSTRLNSSHRSLSRMPSSA